MAEPLRAKPSGSAFGGLDDDLLPAIDRIVRRANASPSRISRVAVSAGPGGYTGLRVACAAAKMIALARGGACDCVRVRSAHSALVGTWAGLNAAESSVVAVMLASKGETSWCEVYQVEHTDPVAARAIAEPRLIDASNVPELLALSVSHVIGDRYVPASIRGAVCARGIPMHAPRFDAIGVLKLAVSGSGGDPEALNPIYPREPDAVTLWRQRHPPTAR